MSLVTCPLSHVLSPMTCPQVADPVAGWTGFRPLDELLWNFLMAVFYPKFLLLSATMSEAALCRILGRRGEEVEEVECIDT